MGAYNVTTNLGVSTVFTSDAAYVHSSFDRTPIPTQYDILVNPSDMSSGTTYGWEFGWSVAVGYGKLVVGAPTYDPSASNYYDGKFYSYDLDGTNGTLIHTGSGNGQSAGWSVAVGCGRMVMGSFMRGGPTNSPEVKIYKLDNTLVSTKTGSYINRFGYSVAVEDNFIAISEPYYNSGQGGVHLYDLDGSSYMTITPSDQSSGDYENFGNSVAMDHGKIIVGSPDDDTPNTGQGSAYIFDRFGIQLKKLTASDGVANDQFGYSVAIGCGKIVVGAPSAEAAYVYNLSGDNEIKLTSPDGYVSSDNYGWSVEVGHSMIAVGAPDYGGVNGNGAVYLYDLRGNFIKKLTPNTSITSVRFGYSVSIGNNVIAVGAPEDIGGSGSNNDGSVHLFNVPEDSNTYWENMLETFRYDRRYK